MGSFELRVKQLSHGEGLPLPSYQSEQAAGVDLVAAVAADEPVNIAPGEWASIPTGIALALLPGTEAQVRPRSGLAARHGVTVLNAPGTIDADYRGEVQVLLINHGRTAFVVERGARIAQLVIAAVLGARLTESAELGVTARGAGGFGSTDLETKASRGHSVAPRGD